MRVYDTSSMSSETTNINNLKVTNRINKLCNIVHGLSDKDIKAVSYIIEKSSRIATVTLLLADVLEENLVLKKELQKSAIGLVSDSSKSLISKNNKDAFIVHLLTLVSLLETAHLSGLLSKMNTETLADDVMYLSEVIGEIDWHVGRRFVDDALFVNDVPREVFSSEPFPTRSENRNRHERVTNVQQGAVTHEQSGRYGVTGIKDISKKVVVKYKERVHEIQKDRRATILGIVQKKDRITVKDVATVIKDCSEKTIQRELLALVRQGVLKKEGERRWSTYSLV